MTCLRNLKNGVRSSKEAPTFESLILNFLDDIPRDQYPSIIVCAIAGVTHGEVIQVANIPHWPIIIKTQVKKALQIESIHFINDLVAAA